jgi:hypothetical protein
VNHVKLQREPFGGFLGHGKLASGLVVSQNCDFSRLRQQLLHQLETLARQHGLHGSNTRYSTARTRRVGDITGSDRVEVNRHEDNRLVTVSLLQC